MKKNNIELPESIPIFPLAGVLLLPTGNLPLHIFEPRYINMVTDALGSDPLDRNCATSPTRQSIYGGIR